MMPTPTIPDWIRNYRANSYTNIYSLCPHETRLYGTESLYGDWGGELLLLAKDFAPSELVLGRIEAGDERPFHHTDWERDPKGPGAQTNRNLDRLAKTIGCRKLYGSALAGLMRNDREVSGALPDMAEVFPFVRDVLRFTVAQMPNLRAVACLGVDAWTLAIAALGGGDAAWGECRTRRTPVEARGVNLFALAHPSRTPGGKATVEADWDAMKRRMGF